MFILVHGSVNGGVDFIDILQSLYHGLSLDMSMSGYLTIMPLLLMVASVWLRPDSPARIFNVYFAIVLSVIAIVTSIDLILYFHWGFHLDPAVLLYLQNPKEVIASGSFPEWVSGLLVAVVFLILSYYGYALIIRKFLLQFTAIRHRVKTCFILALLAGVLFLPIRGGVTVSTMNISHAYFSDRMFLNHAAINPMFNFMYSLGKYDNFGSQYQFYDKNDVVRIFDSLRRQSEHSMVPRLLNTSRPNIILFILESFSYDVALDSIVAPNMYRFAKEGIVFKNFYANGFRTDRGLVSVISGYPSHPTAAILKYPKKTEALPAIPKSLRKNGYDNQSVYYGGDIDFANMRSYFVGACGIQDLISDKDFPVKERLTKWGVPDRPLLERVSHYLTETRQQTPFLKIILTLSSHEPFDVPTDIFDIPFLNSINYTDECVGKFVSDLKSTDLWNNTLIVFVADHAMQSYPQGKSNYEKERFQIPMIWFGGAVGKPAIISDYGSQNDLAATLLSQLQIDYSDFKFSKDMLDPQSRKFSFYSYVNGFCMMDSS
ncbi:MAG: sulfatase-like hydrolase/transferase, partial [Tannerella sp.]|nr:sulfatase-like hydrolase/transferase [Tannerella sp.]